MDASTEMLTYIYQNAKMGMKANDDLIKLLNGKDNKIKSIIDKELKEYEKIVKKTEKLLNKRKIDNPKDKGKLAEMMSKMGISMELMKDNSDARIADMLIKGFTMGNIDIEKKIDRYESDIDKDILKLARELLKFGKGEIELLKEYL